jgi:hypothetical protein
MNDKLFEDICLEIETSWKGIASICKSKGTSWGSFRNHLNKTEDNLTRYTRARELQLDYLEELLREVSFEGSKDSEVIDKVNIGSNYVARDRLKADTLKFILSKLRPQKYGNTLKIEHKGEPRIFNLD